MKQILSGDANSNGINEELKLSTNFKYGREEINLNPYETGNKCGYIVNPVTANDIFVTLSKNTDMPLMPGEKFNPDLHYAVPLIEYIVQRAIRIKNVQVTVNKNIATITWEGDSHVKLSFDDEQWIEASDPANNRHQEVLENGNHKVYVKSDLDMYGIEKTFNVNYTPPKEGVIISMD